MKITISLVYAVIILSGIVLIPNAFAESVPDWVKNTAGWWAEDAISETEFVNAIAYLVDADLSYANLEGANLEGAILDNTIITGANLKCMNHPICESG